MAQHWMFYERITTSVPDCSWAARGHACSRGKGKIDGRERLDRFVDPGSFVGTGIRHYPQRIRRGRKKSLGARSGPEAQKSMEGSVHLLAGFHRARRVLGEMPPEIIEAQLLAMKNEHRSSASTIGRGPDFRKGFLLLRGTPKTSGTTPWLAWSRILVILVPARAALSIPAITCLRVHVDGISHMYITGPVVIRRHGEEITSRRRSAVQPPATKTRQRPFPFSKRGRVFRLIRKLLPTSPPTT
jgi:hypothetical protein